MKKQSTAVALRYPADAEAPIITAKEKGLLADRMVEIAECNNIPVVKNELLTNVLSVQQLGQCIPEETWQTVAEIFVYIQKLENGNAEKFYQNRQQLD